MCKKLLDKSIKSSDNVPNESRECISVILKRNEVIDIIKDIEGFKRKLQKILKLE